MRRSLATAAAMLLVASLAPEALADTRIDLVPSVAFFSPSNNVVDEPGITAKFSSAPAVGGRLSIWMNDRVAFEVTGHFLRSSLDGTVLGQDAGSIDLSMFYGSAQVVFGIGAENRLLLHGGLGVQGTNYDDFIEGANVLSGILGISGWAPLGGSLAFRSDLDTYVHSAWYELDGVRSKELIQFDTLLSVGLQFTPGGR